MNESVLIIATGGTFDKVYTARTEAFSFDGTSVIPGIIDRSRIHDVHYTIEDELKDSNDFLEIDFQRIASRLSDTQFRRVVVVQGTSKLVEAAQSISSMKLDKTVVLTGAFEPYRYNPVEASLNLGASIAYARTLGSGVWICMHGRKFDPFETIKIVAEEKFADLTKIGS